MINHKFTLLTLNVEYDKHRSAVTAMLTRQKPDIFCFQEVPKQYAESFAKHLGYEWRYAPMATLLPRDSNAQIDMGIMIAWSPHLKICDESMDIYSYGDTRSPLLTSEFPNATKRVLLTVQLQYGVNKFRIGTTHFTWTPDGLPSLVQRADLNALLLLLSRYDAEGIILCGDFNAPRGGEIYSMMSTHYTDNLPREITTTIDNNLHRMAPLTLAVDSIFSTNEHTVNQVQIIDGVSDHVALFAQVS